MTETRSDTIPLHDDFARCRPTKPSLAANSCARKLAATPTQYATLADYSATETCSALCSGYINVQSLRKAAQDVPVKKPAAKPWPKVGA